MPLKRLAAYLPVLLLAAACSSPDKPAEQAAVAPAVLPEPPRPASAAPDTAQQRFRWEDEVCSYTGYFPAGKYAEAQLRDSYTLVTFPFAASTYQESIWELEEFHPDSVATRLRHLEQQHRQERATLRALRVLPLPYWQQLKKIRQQEEEEMYQLRKLDLQALFNPQLLLQTPRASRCQRYVRALTSSDTLVLLQAWRELVDAQKKNNGAPEHLEANYQIQLASPERLRYARLELMKFGWWNCANEHRRYVDVEEQQKPRAAFEKLFMQVKPEDCEDVD